MAKETAFKRIISHSTNLEQWKKLSNVINVKFHPKSGWYRFKGVENNMFVLAERNGETFRTNQIFVRCYA